MKSTYVPVHAQNKRNKTFTKNGFSIIGSGFAASWRNVGTTLWRRNSHLKNTPCHAFVVLEAKLKITGGNPIKEIYS